MRSDFVKGFALAAGVLVAVAVVGFVSRKL